MLANLAVRYLKRRLGDVQKGLFDSATNHNVRIAVVCFNRALVAFLRVKTRDSFYQQAMKALPRESLDVCHFNGLLYSLSQQGVFEYVHVEQVSDAVARATTYLSQLQHKTPDDAPYDAIFVDEGQDFEPAEFQLLCRLVRPSPEANEPTIVIFNDDAQNLYGRARPTTWADIGLNVTGGRSRVMKECFRNTRQIIEFAFNVLLGSRAGYDVRTRTFADVANLLELGLVEERQNGYAVQFAERTEPPPTVQLYRRGDEELNATIDELSVLIQEQQVRPEDILVLFPLKESCERFIELLEQSDVRSGILEYSVHWGIVNTEMSTFSDNGT